MMTTDLFEEFGQVAGEYGWQGIGQPLALVRRYGCETIVQGQGRAQVTVSVYANRTGTAISGAERRTVTVTGERTTQRLRHGDAGKRDTVIEWLRRVR